MSSTVKKQNKVTPVNKQNLTEEILTLFDIRNKTKSSKFVKALYEKPMTMEEVKSLPWNKSKQGFPSVFKKLERANIASTTKNGKMYIKEARKIGQSTKNKQTKQIIGITDTIIKSLKEKPKTKDELLKELVKAFPDRNPDGMMTTINTQVPGRLTKKKGFKIVKNEKKEYYIKS